MLWENVELTLKYRSSANQYIELPGGLEVKELSTLFVKQIAYS